MGDAPLRGKVRPTLVDGLFYPARGEALATLVDELLARSMTPEGSCFAVFSPHAGYEYAGEVMASAFRAAARRPVRTAVLIGPVHRDAEPGIFLPESQSFGTPLGDVEVDQEAVERLIACEGPFRRDDIPHLEEHCLEVQLPFVIRVFPGARIVPILVGTASSAGTLALARALRSTFDGSTDSTVYVVSANAASYMTGKDVEEEGAALEALISGMDWKGILSASERRRISACCPAGMAAILSLATRECRVRVLARATSAGRDEDPRRVVQYAAFGLERGST